MPPLFDRFRKRTRNERALRSIPRNGLSSDRFHGRKGAPSDCVGELPEQPSGRLVSGLLLVAVGLGVTGAYLGTPVSMTATAAVLYVIARRRIGVADAAHAANGVANPLRPGTLLALRGFERSGAG